MITNMDGVDLPIPYGRQSIDALDCAAVLEALGSDYLTQGPRVSAFEEAFAARCGARYAVAFSNGTAALHAAVAILSGRWGEQHESERGTNRNGKVLVPTVTFVATANAGHYCGLEPTFVDVDPREYTLDTAHLEALLEKDDERTYKGIIPVHLAGHPCRMEAIRAIAERYGLWVLEDACHAPGAEYQDAEGAWHRVGACAHSEAAVFSFHPVKHIACGEGGMVTTNSIQLRDRLRRFRSHGIAAGAEGYHPVIEKDAWVAEGAGGWFYRMENPGYNYRITDIQCALGLSQLEKLEENLNRRQQIAAAYDAALGDLEWLQAPQRGSDIRHALHLYIVRVKERKALYNYLRENGILVQVHYIPVHLQPFYRRLQLAQGGVTHLPQAEAYYRECLSLPIYPTLTPAQLEYTIEMIRAWKP